MSEQPTPQIFGADAIIGLVMMKRNRMAADRHYYQPAEALMRRKLEGLTEDNGASDRYKAAIILKALSGMKDENLQTILSAVHNEEELGAFSESSPRLKETLGTVDKKFGGMRFDAGEPLTQPHYDALYQRVYEDAVEEAKSRRFSTVLVVNAAINR